jgi:hypothetical protein
VKLIFDFELGKFVDGSSKGEPRKVIFEYSKVIRELKKRKKLYLLLSKRTRKRDGSLCDRSTRKVSNNDPNRLDHYREKNRNSLKVNGMKKEVTQLLKEVQSALGNPKIVLLKEHGQQYIALNASQAIEVFRGAKVNRKGELQLGNLLWKRKKKKSSKKIGHEENLHDGKTNMIMDSKRSLNGRGKNIGNHSQQSQNIEERSIAMNEQKSFRRESSDSNGDGKNKPSRKPLSETYQKVLQDIVEIKNEMNQTQKELKGIGGEVAKYDRELRKSSIELDDAKYLVRNDVLELKKFEIQRNKDKFREAELSREVLARSIENQLESIEEREEKKGQLKMSRKDVLVKFGKKKKDFGALEETFTDLHQTMKRIETKASVEIQKAARGLVVRNKVMEDLNENARKITNKKVHRFSERIRHLGSTYEI